MAFAPSTYYARKKAGAVSEAVLAEAYAAHAVFQVYDRNRRVYGIRKLWHAMWHAGYAMGRDQVARLMAVSGISGAVRGAHRTVTTTRDDRAPRFTRSCGASIESAEVAGSVVGGGLHARVDARRVRVRRCPRRCVLPPDPRTASPVEQAHARGHQCCGAGPAPRQPRWPNPGLHPDQDGSLRHRTQHRAPHQIPVNRRTAASPGSRHCSHECWRPDRPGNQASPHALGTAHRYPRVLTRGSSGYGARTPR